LREKVDVGRQMIYEIFDPYLLKMLVFVKLKIFFLRNYFLRALSVSKIIMKNNEFYDAKICK